MWQALKSFFLQDRIRTGLVVALGGELLSALLIWAILAVQALPVAGHERLFAAAFIVPVIALRSYAKGKQHPLTTKTLMIVLFASFVCFMMFLFRTNALSM